MGAEGFALQIAGDHALSAMLALNHFQYARLREVVLRKVLDVR